MKKKQIEYYDNGEIFAEGYLLNGKKEGKWTEYYTHGGKSRECTFVAGKASGEYIVWQNSTLSRIVLMGICVNGKKEGTWIRWSATNPIDDHNASYQSTTFKNDKQEYSWKYIWGQSLRKKKYALGSYVIEKSELRTIILEGNKKFKDDLKKEQELKTEQNNRLRQLENKYGKNLHWLENKYGEQNPQFSHKMKNLSAWEQRSMVRLKDDAIKLYKKMENMSSETEDKLRKDRDKARQENTLIFDNHLCNEFDVLEIIERLSKWDRSYDDDEIIKILTKIYQYND